MMSSSQAGRRAARVILTLAMVSVFGCSGSGKGKATTTVSGRVTYKGAPVTVGAIYFHGPDGQMAMGNINEDGSFTATDVLVGEARVSLQVRDPGAYSRQLSKDGKPSQGAGARAASTGVTSVPAKYADPNTSDLKYLIEAGMKGLEVKLE